MKRSLTDWLDWQATLNPREIDLGLARVRRVVDQLSLERPPAGILTVGGTNGKGTTVGFIERLCVENGFRTAVYTSPHLVRYNERMRLDGREVEDEWLIEQFAVVDEARGETPLTYFEFGTLAALHGFTQARADIWILEVGLGGRLDAVNVIDPDISVVTTVGLEHQDWLGNTIDAIAVEKAGILRAGRPAFYGDEPVPAGFRQTARAMGAHLSCQGIDFGYTLVAGKSWDWWGATTSLDRLTLPPLSDPAQMRNVSVGLAAIESLDPTLLQRSVIEQALSMSLPPGRFQLVDAEDRQWIVDVAHNPQAARLLRERLLALVDRRSLTVVIGMLADKQIDQFVIELTDLAERWIACSIDTDRGCSATSLAEAIRRAGGRNVSTSESIEQALGAARTHGSPDQRILVTGSFHIAGPALCWLGLY